ncbi:MAG: hypothetical protein M3220_02170 [Chloroflexota bacterium]|nr:hypothetical protein [Chloroflexota bacterium]
MAEIAQGHNGEYDVGVMKVLVEGEENEEFHTIVDEAVEMVEEHLSEVPGLNLHVFEFIGPHLSAVEGTYSPLDFLQIGLTEKLERHVQFLLIITEVDLSPTVHSYVLALPSRLTNVGILSSKRLHPEFWGKQGDISVTAQRLSSLMLHTIGHLLNLPHDPDPANIMYDFGAVEELEQMTTVTAKQVAEMKRNLPDEAREEIGHDNSWQFTLRQVAENWRNIWRAVMRANPFRLALQLPTMITAAFSLIIVLFFTAEIWDVASTLSFIALAILSVVGVLGATLVLYRAFNISPGRGRTKGIAESTVVAASATALTLLLTMLLLYIVFFLLGFASGAIFFPEELKETWQTAAGDVGTTRQHVKLGIFLAAMGVLVGSLGAGADRKAVIRRVLFLDEET